MMKPIERDAWPIDWASSCHSSKVSWLVTWSPTGLMVTNRKVPFPATSGLTAGIDRVTRNLSIQSAGGTTNNLVISVGASSSINLKNVIVKSPAGGSLCNFSNQSSQNTCVFTGPATNVTVQFSNYTEVKTQGNNTITTDRKVCFPADARILLTTVTGDGTAADTVTITLSALAAQNYNLVVSVIPQADTCAVGELSLTPNP